MEKKLLTVKEACEYLSISKATLYKLIKEGKIKPVKIGKSTRFDRQDLDRLVEELKRNSWLN
ncbi:transcriptional regulator, AlpA family [Balnearium lithotrophicum]|uniref:Transcriptional regulator, AlpA family n=1 Tax=Balnearium lithotrophicum TaxID=223788 RepID=A0A521CQX6_9BACT|nr:helix-turn-helix domain-containing protein [Balnearium lithotrophicum]SMO61070.1 transcriptional regulator, AlpA family [Balnearium lithotrophicum]